MAKVILNEKNIADYMKRNKCSREEAIELINYDNAVEGDEATEFDLTPEQQETVKTMMRKVDHAKQEGKVKRERKPNELKEAIVAELAEFLREDAQGQGNKGQQQVARRENAILEPSLIGRRGCRGERHEGECEKFLHL